MLLEIKGKVREYSDEAAEFEDRATGKKRSYRKRLLSLFVPDGKGMGESVAVNLRGDGPRLPLEVGDEVCVRIRGYEEDLGLAKVTAQVGDVQRVPAKVK